MPKVSICIPVYNVEQFLERCIESVQNQTFQDVEIIIVNDCSPDNSVEIIKTFSKQDKRIVLINHDDNFGLMWARRTGYKLATGDYVLFCDSDDTMPLNAVELLYRKAVTENADLVIGNYSKVYQDGAQMFEQNSIKYGTTPKDLYKALLRGECSHTLWAKLFRRELLCNYEYETRKNHTNAEDVMLFYQLVKNVSKVAIVDDSVYNYFQNANSSTHVELSENALEGIYYANYIRMKMTSEYDDLRRDLCRKIIMLHINLIRRGYDQNLIQSLENKYTLSQFYNRKNLFKYFSLFELIKYHLLTLMAIVRKNINR